MEKNDKARAVLVYQILRDESGEENRLSLKDIIGKIEKKGISAERRAVTRDIAKMYACHNDVVENTLTYMSILNRLRGWARR